MNKSPKDWTSTDIAQHCARLGGQDFGPWAPPPRARRQSAFAKVRAFIGWSFIGITGLSILVLLSDAVSHYIWSCGAC